MGSVNRGHIRSRQVNRDGHNGFPNTDQDTDRNSHASHLAASASEHLSVQTPSSAQISTAIEAPKNVGEHLNHNAANKMIESSDSRISKHHFVCIVDSTKVETEKFGTFTSSPNGQCDDLLKSKGPSVFSHFNSVQALLLSGLRFLGPRRSRDTGASYPRQCPARRPWPWLVRARFQSATRSQPRPDRVRDQSVTTTLPCPHPRSQPVHHRSLVQTANVRLHSVSVTRPRPSPVRSHAQSATAICPRSQHCRNQLMSGSCAGHDRSMTVSKPLLLPPFSAYVLI